MQTQEADRRAFRRSRAAVAATFSAHAVGAGTLGPWIPRLKRDNGLDPAGLGIALTGFAVGLLIGTRLAGPLLRRFGGRAVVRVGIPALAACLAMLPIADGLAMLTTAFVAFGIVTGLLDVAMNTEAVDVEGRFGRHVMSSMHGTWSVSVFAGAVLASIGVAAGVAIELHFAAVAVGLTAASFPFLRWLPAPRGVREAPVDAGSSEPGRAPTLRVVLVCLVAAASFLTEGIAADWSAVYLRESAGADAGTAGIGVVAFSAGMAISRFAGDRVAVRADPAVVVRVGTALAAVVLGVALAVGETVPFIVALAILGLSLGPVVPLTFRSAGGIGLRADRSALAVTVTAGYLGSIVGPLLVGFIADRVGLGAGFLVPVVACVAAAACAGALGRRRS
jgi:predicted MFS family arabinose efflux permease